MKLLLTIIFAMALVVATAVPAMSTEYPVHFGWDANTETDLAGYRLYQKTDASGQYEFGEGFEVAAAGPTDTAVSIAISEEKTYHWVLTAYDTSGNESDPSNEVSFTLEIPDTTPPNAPGGFSVTVNITFNLTAPTIAAND